MRKRTVVPILGAVLVVALATVGAAAERLELQVDGMACPFCEAAVESVLRAQPGVVEADADFRTGRAVVVYDPQRTDPEKIAASINTRSFYRARPVEPGESAGAQKRAR